MTPMSRIGRMNVQPEHASTWNCVDMTLGMQVAFPCIRLKSASFHNNVRARLLGMLMRVWGGQTIRSVPPLHRVPWLSRGRLHMRLVA